MKNLSLSFVIIISTLMSQCDPSYAGKIQKQDIKTSAECISAGATDATCLPTTAQIYESITSQQLATAFSTSIVGTLLGQTKVSLTADVVNTLPHGKGGTDVTSPGSSGNVLTSDGTNWTSAPAVGGGTATAKFDLEGSVVLYTGFGGNHRQPVNKTLSTVDITLLNCGLSGTTTVRVNQYRNSAVATNTATATIAASIDANGPCSSTATLSGNLTILAGDIITVDVTGVASGFPENLTVEY